MPQRVFTASVVGIASIRRVGISLFGVFISVHIGSGLSSAWVFDSQLQHASRFDSGRWISPGVLVGVLGWLLWAVADLYELRRKRGTATAISISRLFLHGLIFAHVVHIWLIRVVANGSNYVFLDQLRLRFGYAGVSLAYLWSLTVAAAILSPWPRDLLHLWPQRWNKRILSIGVWLIWLGFVLYLSSFSGGLFLSNWK